MKLQAITDHRVVTLLKETGKAWLEDNALRLSAALAYYSVFSIAPLLIIAISVAGLVLGEEAVRGQLDNQLARYIGAQAATAVQSLVQSASKPADGWIGAVVGFATLLLGASGVFGQLKDALNTISGAVVTALFFEAGKFGLGWHLGRESTTSSYGAAGSVVLLLLWVYYASCILLLGAEFTQVYARETGHAILPTAGAVAVTAEVRAQQGLVPVGAVQGEPPPATEIIEGAPTPVERSPLGALFALSAASFVVGFLALRRMEKEKEPVTRIREGLADLGGQTTENLTELLRSVRSALIRRMR